MLQVKSLFTIICFVITVSLFGQPVSEDIVLLYGPTITETIDQIDVISTYTAPVGPSEEAHVLTPSGNVVQTDAGKLAVFIDADNQAGIYRFYFPMSGLRTKLIVD